MQVATLFRETAKVLGASMDSIQCCMKAESQADDGYETCIDTVCGNHVERMLSGPGNSLDSQNLRMDEHLGGHHPHRSSSMSGGMKMEQYGDPYSFVDEPNNICLPNNNNMIMSSHLPPQTKKRGRRKKPDVKVDDYGTIVSGRDNDVIMDKERKRHYDLLYASDRFNGLSEEEVSQRTLPDHLAPNLDIVIIGINPGLFAAYKGHHYAGPGNHFWKCLYLSGLVPEPLTADDDCRLLRHGIGFTNMVARPTKGSADLTRREIKQGSQILQEKLQKYRPKVAVFNGKLIYEVFSGKKDFPFGRQPEFVEGTNTYIWVMPSSSARCAQLPRAADKVPFYSALKRFRDYLNGLIPELDESEVVFNDTKPMCSSKNGELKNSMMEPNSCSPLEDPNLGGFIPEVIPNKKKRGRPRKGMEKHPPNSSSKREKLMKKEMLPELNGKNKMMGGDKNKSNCFDGLSIMDNLKRSSPIGGNNNNNSNNGGGRPIVEIQRKRRGRPKKAKPEDSPPSFSSLGNSNIGSSNTPESLLMDVNSGCATNNTGTCQPPTASSVSSGYSTATSTGDERTRNRTGGDENGSGGPSPSHHSYTQSDLSSEISAAISCGSAPPSPNGHTTDSVFDTLSSVTLLSREDGQSKSNNNLSQQQQSSKLSMSSLQGNQRLLSPNSHCGPSSSSGGSNLLYMNPPSHDPSSYMPYHHHQSFDNRLHSLTTRSQLYQPSNVRDGPPDNSMQTSSNPSFHSGGGGGGNSGGHGSYESNNKSFDVASIAGDVASKSLSGLESLVDQIPSIADSDVGTIVSGGNCLLPPDPISHHHPHHHHPQSLSSVGSTPTLSHSGHHYVSSNEPPGFLPYGHGPPPPNPVSYANSPHHYAPTYYPSDLGSTGFPVNSLSPAAAAAAAYCSPSPLFGFSSYGQYPSTHPGVPTGYPHSSAAAAAALHLQSAYGGGPPGYPQSAYGTGPNPYQHGNSSAAASGQRFPQRLHLRQDGGMDLGFSGF